jgi:hypothetical protein
VRFGLASSTEVEAVQTPDSSGGAGIPAGAQRCWRLDHVTDGDGGLVPQERIDGWRLGGIYLHVQDPDNPPRYAGFDEQTANFLTLHWTEVPDPRGLLPSSAAAGGAR